jgi:small subunit ribosomal protein S6
VHPALEAGRLKDLILSVEKSMHNAGGETCAINVWGKKKLAYPINKEKYGMYILFQFKSDGSSNKEFNLGLEHNTNVLAYLTTKIESEGVLSDLPDLDNQLGLSTIKNEDTNKNNESKDSETPKAEESNDDKTEDSSSNDKNKKNE